MFLMMSMRASSLWIGVQWRSCVSQMVFKWVQVWSAFWYYLSSSKEEARCSRQMMWSLLFCSWLRMVLASVKALTASAGLAVFWQHWPSSKSASARRWGLDEADLRQMSVVIWQQEMAWSNWALRQQTRARLSQVAQRMMLASPQMSFLSWRALLQYLSDWSRSPSLRYAMPRLPRISATPRLFSPNTCSLMWYAASQHLIAFSYSPFFRFTMPRLLYASPTEVCFSPWIFLQQARQSRQLRSASSSWPRSQFTVPMLFRMSAFRLSLPCLCASRYACSQWLFACSSSSSFSYASPRSISRSSSSSPLMLFRSFPVFRQFTYTSSFGCLNLPFSRPSTSQTCSKLILLLSSDSSILTSTCSKQLPCLLLRIDSTSFFIPSLSSRGTSFFMRSKVMPTEYTSDWQGLYGRCCLPTKNLPSLSFCSSQQQQISGAQQAGDPLTVFLPSRLCLLAGGFRNLDPPRSAILYHLSSLEQRMFCGLMSRCVTECLFIRQNPSTSWNRMQSSSSSDQQLRPSSILTFISSIKLQSHSSITSTRNFCSSRTQGYTSQIFRIALHSAFISACISTISLTADLKSGSFSLSSSQLMNFNANFFPVVLSIHAKTCPKVPAPSSCLISNISQLQSYLAFSLISFICMLSI